MSMRSLRRAVGVVERNSGDWRRSCEAISLNKDPTVRNLFILARYFSLRTAAALLAADLVVGGAERLEDMVNDCSIKVNRWILFTTCRITVYEPSSIFDCCSKSLLFEFLPSFSIGNPAFRNFRFSSKVFVCSKTSTLSCLLSTVPLPVVSCLSQKKKPSSKDSVPPTQRLLYSSKEVCWQETCGHRCEFPRLHRLVGREYVVYLVLSSL